MHHCLCVCAFVNLSACLVHFSITQYWLYSSLNLSHYFHLPIWLCPRSMLAIKFHPSGRMLMAASGDKKIRFFQIDGDKNEKLMSESDLVSICLVHFYLLLPSIYGHQRSHVQCSAVQYGAVKCSAVQYGAVQCSSWQCFSSLLLNLHWLIACMHHNAPPLQATHSAVHT